MSQETPRAGQNAELRRTLQTSRDPRVMRTRGAIVDAVHRLAEEGLDSISVADIVRAAGVSQSSFYSHFASLDELSASIFANATTSFGESGSFWQALVDHYAENHGLYRAVLALPPSLEVHNRSAAGLAEQLRASVAPERVPEHVDAAIVTQYLVHGATGVLNAWLLGRLPATREQLVAHLTALAPEWLR